MRPPSTFNLHHSMPLRQQPTLRNRRNGSIGTPPSRLDIGWVFELYSDTQVVLYFSLPGTLGNVDFGNLVVTGVPRLAVNGFVYPWVVSEMDGSHMILEAGSVLAASGSYALPANDPAVRSDTGGFLVSQVGQYFEPQELNINSVGRDAADVWMVQFGGVATGIASLWAAGGYAPLGVPLALPSGIPASSFEPAGPNALRIQWPGDVTAETELQFALDGMVVDNAGHVLPAQTWTVP